MEVPASVSLEQVLVTTDFSSSSQRALPYAAALACQYGSKLHLLHVIDPLPYRFAAGEEGRQRRERVWQEAEGKMRALSNSQFLRGVPNEIILRDGEVEEVVSETVRRGNIDLVVISTHGGRGVERLLLGSVAEAIFRTATCPVLVVGPEANEKGQVSFDKILYPVELTKHSLSALPYLASLSEQYGSRITLLHLVHPDIQSPSERHRIRSRVERELLDVVPEELRRHKEEIIVEFGNVASSVIEFSLATKANLIVLGLRGGGALSRAATFLPWTIAHQIIAGAPCPVLTVKGAH